MKQEHRIMRVPLPVTLIRAMDAAIGEGLGGYETRTELIVDAIQDRILELSVGVVEFAGPPVTVTLEKPEFSTPPKPSLLPGPASISVTALNSPATGPFVAKGDDLSRPEGRALFGLHNRDYPSLWALTQLAHLTADGLVSAEVFYSRVLGEAWKYGELLLAIENHLGIKCTAQFPTNLEKRKQAEMGFRSFAVGDYRAQPDGTFATSGPLFEWQFVGLVDDTGDEPLIGVTPDGWNFLEVATAISVEQPHDVAVAARFLDHLEEHAPEDRRGFREVVRAIGPSGATRKEVLAHIAQAWEDWTVNEVSTNSAGYIARAREWGLVEAKQFKGQYHLTPLGHEYATGENQ